MADQIFLIRHGQTHWSLSGRHTGETDLPLTETGESNAMLLRGALKEIHFSQVFTSPRQRARKTCELAGLAAQTCVEPDLVEWNYGAYEGKTTSDIRKLRPDWEIFRNGCPGGESVEQVSLRADRLLDKLKSQEGTLALFSHAHFLRALTARWLEQPLVFGRHLILDTGSLSILGYEHANDTTPGLKLWNARPSGIASSFQLGAAS